MGRGIGYGKIIVFGEHFVVHGAPAIAGGISSNVIVETKESKKNRIITERKIVEEAGIRSIESMLAVMGIQKRYDIYLEGDLPTYGGLGSSAAFCVAFVNALAEDKGVNLTREEINRYAYEGEKAFHGNPSGIDNTVATYRGVVEFRKGKTPSESNFEFIELGKPLEMVVSFTGKYSPTQKMVEAVRVFKEQDEKEFGQLMDEYTDLEAEGRKAIEKGKLDVIGRLMNSNQSLLSEVGVSDEANDRINRLALDAGALGAKLTGGGGGGCCIALAKNKKHAAEIKEILKRAGFASFATRITK